jgi:hypothetical protein
MDRPAVIDYGAAKGLRNAHSCHIADGMTTRPRFRSLLHGLPGGHAGRPAPLAAALLAAALLAALLAVAACSTARQRDTPQGPLTLLHYRDPATAAYFRDTYRSGNLYEDFRPALVVDAIVEDRTYRRLYVEMLRKQFLLSDADVARMQAEQEQQFETRVTLLLFTYEGTNTVSQLDKANAPWRLFLRDDDGQLEVPASVTPIKPGDPTYLYMDRYFSGLDRWSRVYRVEFPKLSKGRLGQPLGKSPFQLIMTGVRGSVTLKWDDPRLFYAVPDGTGR